MIQKIKVWLYIPHHLIMQILLHVAVCTDLTPAGCNIQIIHHFPSFSFQIGTWGSGFWNDLECEEERGSHLQINLVKFSRKKKNNNQRATSNLIYEIYSHRIVYQRLITKAIFQTGWGRALSNVGENKSTNAARIEGLQWCSMTWNVSGLHVRKSQFVFFPFSMSEMDEY